MLYPNVPERTAGLDITQALQFGYARLKQEFDKLTRVQQADLAVQLIEPPLATRAWDIFTLKRGNPTKFQVSSQQTICTPSDGINANAPKTLVTIVSCGVYGAYSTDAVNYILFGEAMSLVYNNYNEIMAAAQGADRKQFAADPLAKLWLCCGHCARCNWGWSNTDALVTLWPRRCAQSLHEQRRGNRRPGRVCRGRLLQR